MDINEKYLSLKTFRRNGAEVDTPVWFASRDAATHYLFSAADAGKVKRLRNNPSARIARCDLRGGSLGEWQDCRALLVTDPDEMAQAYQLLIRKYGWQMHLTNFFSRLSGRINHRAVIRLDTVTRNQPPDHG